MLPKDALNRIDEEFIEKYYREDDSDRQVVEAAD